MTLEHCGPIHVAGEPNIFDVQPIWLHRLVGEPYDNDNDEPTVSLIGGIVGAILDVSLQHTNIFHLLRLCGHESV